MTFVSFKHLPAILSNVAERQNLRNLNSYTDTAFSQLKMALSINGMIVVGSPVQWYTLFQFVSPLFQGAPGAQQALISTVSPLGNSLCPSGAVTHFLPMAHLILSAARA